MEKNQLIELMKWKAINPETKEEADELLEYLYSLGFLWRIFEKRCYYIFGKRTIFFLEQKYIKFGEIECFNDYEILTYQEFKKMIKEEK